MFKHDHLLKQKLLQKRSTVLSTLTFLMVSSNLYAIDAGSIQRDIETNLNNQQMEKQNKKRLLIEHNSHNDLKVLIKRFKFSGNTLIAESALQDHVANYVGKELSIKDLKEIVASLTDYYSSHGGLVKVYLPKQDVTDGTVTIAIIESKLNNIIIQNKESKFSELIAQKYINAQTRKGEPISTAKIATALINLNNIGGLDATSAFAKGANEESSDVVIELKDTTKFTGNVCIDNYGSKSTGFNEFNAAFTINNLSQSALYDNLNVMVLASMGVRYSRVDYSFPVGYSGDKIGITHSLMKYYLSSEPKIPASGYSSTVSIYENHPIISSGSLNFSWKNELSYKEMHNSYEQMQTSFKKMVTLSSTLSLDNSDEFWGGGKNYGNLTFTVGNLNLKPNQSDYENDALTTQTNGSFAKYSAYLSRTQTLTEALSLQLNFQGQTAFKNLDSSQQMSLGGAYAVRAYPSGEGGGSVGYLASTELKYAATEELSPSLFVDYSVAKAYAKVNENITQDIQRLSGFGVALQYSPSQIFNVQAQLTRRIITGYNPYANGTNSDGSPQGQNRLWLTSSYYF